VGEGDCAARKGEARTEQRKAKKARYFMGK
jgi:hypothetical protein